jgi:drug/metabolite transporter (DMT)-like permease
MLHALPERARVLALTAVAMVAFAANSLLCRMALAPAAIDPASFTSIRLFSGALTLWLLVRWQHGPITTGKADWTAAAALFLYAITFSFAYLSLNAGVGTLILFGFVQLTMLAAALQAGERLTRLAWFGLLLAVAGLLYLLSPGLTAPDPLGALLMAVAGIAWGAYSLRGRGVRNPLQATAGNFARAAPMALLVSLVLLADAQLGARGALLAVASGALASGMGYALWYAALPGLDASHAATVQLSVPVIAAAAAVPLLDEPVTLRLLLSSMAVLGGIALVLRQRTRRRG